MKKLFLVLALCGLCLMEVTCTGSGGATATKEPVDYVNPYIGNISHLLVPTFATVQLPNCLMRIYPTRGDYTTEMLDGLPVVVTNHRERSAFRLSVTQGTELRSIIPVTWDQERITPYDYHVEVADNTIGVSLAVAPQSAVYELEFFDPSKPATLVFYSERGLVEASSEGTGEAPLLLTGSQAASRRRW